MSKTCKLVKSILNTINMRGKPKLSILITPRPSLDKDVLCRCSVKDKRRLLMEFSDALYELQSDNVWVLDPNEFIIDTISHSETDMYYMDYIHPTPLRGIYLYSESFLKSLKKYMKFVGYEEENQ